MNNDELSAGSATAFEGEPGVVQGRPLVWLRVEAASIAVASLTLFASTSQPWWLLPALFLTPDLGALGLFAGRRVGALSYNVTHAAPLPLALLGLGLYRGSATLIAAAAVWLFHVSIDRVLKYGFKYDHDSSFTHLGRHGPRGG